MSMGRGGIYGDPRSDLEKEQERVLFGQLSPDTQAAVNEYAQMEGLLAPAEGSTMVGGLLGAAPAAPRGFWNGGDKFRTRDGIAGLLAVVGDALAQNGGYRPTAVDALVSRRSNGATKFEEAQKAYQQLQMVSRLPGITPREMLAFAADPKAWGGHMADAYSTHHAAANMNPGEQRVYANPNAGGSIYQAPTAAEQYAASMGKQPGTSEQRTALQDYVLRGNGPTAFGYDTALDNQRTANKRGLESQRQTNRINLRGVPTYRDANPQPPRATGTRTPRRKANPTATGKNGEKYEYNGKSWVRTN